MIEVLRLLMTSLSIIIFCACGASVQRGLVIWSEDNQILLDVGSNEGIGVGDKASIYREIQLTHPASGENLGVLREELTDASIIAVRKSIAIAHPVASERQLSGNLSQHREKVEMPIKPGDKVVIKKKQGVQTTPLYVTIGSVTFIEAQSRNIEITFPKSVKIDSGEILIVAMPVKIIKHPVSGVKIALQMKKIAAIEVTAVDSNLNTASCRITESSGSPEIGDVVVKLSEPSISSWFQEIDESFEKMIYQRAYRQAIRYYESAEYWQVIRNLRTIKTLEDGFEDILYLFATSYKQLGMYEEAEKYFHRAVSQRPQDAKIWLEMAYMYLEQNRLKEAVHAYQQLTELLPNNYQLWTELSQIYRRMGEQAKSNAAEQKAYQLRLDDE